MKVTRYDVSSSEYAHEELLPRFLKEKEEVTKHERHL